MRTCSARLLGFLLILALSAPAALAQGRRGEKRYPGPSVGGKAPDLVVNVLQNWPEEDEEAEDGETEAKIDPEKTSIKLSELWEEKPVVLIFGSYT